MAHGRQKSAPKRLTELPRYHRLCCCSWAAFHAVNYYYRRVSVHLSGHSSLAATHPTTCNKTALRHRHRQAPKHTHTQRQIERGRVRETGTATETSGSFETSPGQIVKRCTGEYFAKLHYLTWPPLATYPSIHAHLPLFRILVHSSFDCTLLSSFHLYKYFCT